MRDDEGLQDNDEGDGVMQDDDGTLSSYDNVGM